MVTGRFGSARARAVRTRGEAERRISEPRTRKELVDAALEAGDIDRRRAGSLLAGAIAVRVFLWLLPAALLAAQVGLVSVLPGLVSVAVAVVLWLGVSSLLPHAADARWRALVPGAMLFAIGGGGMHFATVYHLAPKLAKEGSLHGSRGTAAVLLFWLYLLFRMAVASAFLNVTIWRRTPHG